MLDLLSILATTAFSLNVSSQILPAISSAVHFSQNHCCTFIGNYEIRTVFLTGNIVVIEACWETKFYES